MGRPLLGADNRSAMTPGSIAGSRRCTASTLKKRPHERSSYGLHAASPSRRLLDQKNSPSQFRFRPPLPLTFAFRLLPSDSVSTYLRSVLGAIGNLTSRADDSRGRKRARPQFAKFSLFNISTADLATCGQLCGKGINGD